MFKFRFASTSSLAIAVDGAAAISAAEARPDMVITVASTALSFSTPLFPDFFLTINEKYFNGSKRCH